MRNIKKPKRDVVLLLFVIVMNLQGCSQNEKKPLPMAAWKQQLETQLPLLGHRDWILIGDKAFPLQTTDGVSMIYAEEELFDVLNYTLSRIGESNHIKPVIYKDKELDFINEDLVPGIDSYRSSLAEVIGQSNVQVLSHDSVFIKIDEASKLFKILVIKTNQIIPYSVCCQLFLSCYHFICFSICCKTNPAGSLNSSRPERGVSAKHDPGLLLGTYL